jgi:hypothetical protein
MRTRHVLFLVLLLTVAWCATAAHGQTEKTSPTPSVSASETTEASGETVSGESSEASASESPSTSSGSASPDEETAKAVGAAGTAVAGAMGVFFILWLALWALMMLLALGLTALWIWMLVDVIKREFPQPNDKTTWILVVVLAGQIGALIYYFMIKRKYDQAAKLAAAPPTP